MRRVPQPRRRKRERSRWAQSQCARAELAERAPFVFVEPAVDRAVAIAQSFRLGQSAREVVAAGQVYVWTESKTGGPPVWEDLQQISVVLVPPKTQQTMAASSGSPAQDAEEKEKAIKRLSVDPTDEQAKKVLRDEAQAAPCASSLSKCTEFKGRTFFPFFFFFLLPPIFPDLLSVLNCRVRYAQ